MLINMELWDDLLQYLPFSKQLSKFVTLLLGEDLHLAEKGAQETSSVVVETVQKVSKNRAGQGVVLPLFKSDASKVTCKGMGLKKAYLQKQNMFTVSCADAGLSTHYLIPSTFVRFEWSHLCCNRASRRAFPSQVPQLSSGPTKAWLFFVGSSPSVIGSASIFSLFRVSL